MYTNHIGFYCMALEKHRNTNKSNTILEPVAPLPQSFKTLRTKVRSMGKFQRIQLDAYMYAYITQIHTYIHTSIHTSIHTNIHPKKKTQKKKCMDVCINVWMDTYIH